MRVLTREGGSPRTSETSYEVVAQLVFLYRAYTWSVIGGILGVLEYINMGVSWMITGNIVIFYRA